MTIRETTVNPLLNQSSVS